MSNTATLNGQNYHSAKMWEIALFTLNNTSTNLHMLILGLVTYYATGIAGLAVMVISTILMAARIFDGVIDPAIGYVIDKTESRFGKFSPLILLGNLISGISIVCIFSMTHLLPQSMQFIFFVAMLIINKIGYSFQTSVTKAAQTVLTNNPKQRPLYAIFDGVFNALFLTGGGFVISNFLVPKHGGFTLSFFNELNIYGLIVSALFAVMAIIGIRSKDKKEYYGLAEETVSTSLREYWGVIKSNRPLQMLSLSASFDKLATSIASYSVVTVMLYGILLGNYALSGQIGLITLIPSLAITVLAVGIARKTGLKRAYVVSAWVGMLSFLALIALFLIVEPSAVSLQSIGLPTILFLLLLAIANGFSRIPTTLVVPMIADVSDYETHKSGRFVPGMMGTIFSFIDQLFSSLAPTIVGAVVGIIGYTSTFPEIGEALTTPLFIVTLVLAFGLPALCLLLSITFMKFYKLDKQKMESIQQTISEMKEKGYQEVAATQK